MKAVKILCLIILMGLVSCNDAVDLNNQDLRDQDDAEAPISSTVSLQEARKNLEEILKDIDRQSETRGVVQKHIKSSFTVSLNGSVSGVRSSERPQLHVHVFNFDNENGFAMMAADRNMPSLIALTNSGHYPTAMDDENPGFEMFLDNLVDTYGIAVPPAKPINPNDSLPIEEFMSVISDQQTIVYKPGGYCKVTWGQNYPYNMCCPIIGDSRALTGCAATAIAQFMSIYKYPNSYNGSTYGWDEMTATPNATYASDDTKQQIARLMVDVGSKSNLNMNYGVTASGSDPLNITKTLKNMGYSNEGQYKVYNSSEVENELKNGNNIILTGYRPTNEGKKGHAWLGHGLLEQRYTTEEYSNGQLINIEFYKYSYILCNWGWNGDCDGYYLSNVFTPSINPPYGPETRSGGYNTDTHVVIGIRK